MNIEKLKVYEIWHEKAIQMLEISTILINILSRGHLQRRSVFD